MRFRVMATALLLVAGGTPAYDLGGPCGSKETFHYTSAFKIEAKRSQVRRNCSNPIFWVWLAEAHYLAGQKDKVLEVFEEMRQRKLSLLDDDIQETDSQAAFFGGEAGPNPGKQQQSLSDWMASDEFAATDYGRWRQQVHREAASRHRRLLDSLPSELRPPALYVAEDSCPFECCQFGPWKATAPIPLFDRPQGTAVVARLRTNEPVEVLTGTSYVEPVPYVVVYHPETEVSIANNPPQVQWALDSLGEGELHVWRNGRLATDEVLFDFYDVCEFPSTRCPQESLNGRNFRNRRDEWWKKIRTRKAKVGWTRDNHFEGADGCG